MWKFSDLHRVLRKVGLANSETIHRPLDDPPHDWFEAVHDPAYYRSFLAGQLGEKQERQIGFRD